MSSQKTFTYPGGSTKLRTQYQSATLARFMSESEMRKLDDGYSKNAGRTSGRKKPTEKQIDIATWAAHTGPKAASLEFKVHIDLVYSAITRVAMWNFYYPEDAIVIKKRK